MKTLVRNRNGGSATPEHILSITVRFRRPVTAVYAKAYVAEALRYYTAVFENPVVVSGGIQVEVAK